MTGEPVLAGAAEADGTRRAVAACWCSPPDTWPRVAMTTTPAARTAATAIAAAARRRLMCIAGSHEDSDDAGRQDDQRQAGQYPRDAGGAVGRQCRAAPAADRHHRAASDQAEHPGG